MLDMRILVCGHREFDDWNLLNTTLGPYLENWISNPTDGLVIIEGEAKGADFLARVWAKYNGVTFEAYPADWTTYGKAAGPIRNKQMLVEGKPNLVIAFLSKGSIGTANMIKQSKDYGVEVKVIEI